MGFSVDRRAAEDAARLARRMLAPVRERIIELAQTLVMIDTTAVPPDGREAPAQEVLARLLRRCGLDVELYDTGFILRRGHSLLRRERRYNGRPNVIARVPGRGGGMSLLFSGHIDTVPRGPGSWRTGPWSGAIRNGRLYGRGSCDMKGGLAAQFGVCMALKHAGVRLRGDVLAESVVDEEWAGGGGTLAARLRGDTADACVIGEVSNLEVCRATRGGHFFDLELAAGDPGRYFSREEVLGPAVPLGRLLGWIDGWVLRRRKEAKRGAYRDFVDPAPVQVLAVEANRFDPEIPWSVPLEARVRVYFQFLPLESPMAVMRRVRTSLERFCSNDPFFRNHPPKWCDIVDPPLAGHELPRAHPWTQCLVSSVSAVLRRPVDATAAGFPCDAFINQDHFGIPTLVFGPSGAGAHNVDEYVTIRSVLRTAEAGLTAALLWSGG